MYTINTSFCYFVFPIARKLFLSWIYMKFQNLGQSFHNFIKQKFNILACIIYLYTFKKEVLGYEIIKICSSGYSFVFLILAAAAVMYVPAALLMLYVFNYSKRMLMVFAVIIAIFVAAVLIMFVIRIFKDIVIVLSTKKQSKFRNKKVPHQFRSRHLFQ